MFEFDQDAVEVLLSDNSAFRRLFEKHSSLKTQVRDANLGAVPMDDATLEELKKEKLLVKDRMAAIIREYRQVHH